MAVTDHAMLQMTGAELAERIAETYQDLPATGYGELPHGAKASGVKLSKPFSQQQLDAALAAAKRVSSKDQTR
jgi:FixJ family two-component response regulator